MSNTTKTEAAASSAGRTHRGSAWRTRRWSGYGRRDGTKGVRNLIVVVYTVECAKHVAHRIARDEDDVHVVGFPGCYDNQYAVRLLLAMVRNPNVGAVLAVGLGCEYTRPDRIAQVAAESGREASWFYIQDKGGTRRGIESGKAEVARLRARLAGGTPRVEMTAADLVIGAECGGSDATSGLAANPVVGRAYDKLVEAGGTAVWEELVEMIGLKEVLCARAACDSARGEIEAAYDKMDRYCKDARQYSVSPGNFAGGITTIEEKSLGSYSKSGSGPIQGVIKVAQRPPHPGLWLLDSVPDPHFMQFGYTNPNDTEGLMDLISAGSHILIYTTGRGSVTGSPIAPTVKVTGNNTTYRRMEDDMDFNAGRVLTGRLSMDQAADELLDLLVETAAGTPTKPEALGHREYFIMYKHQDTPSLEAGCRV